MSSEPVLESPESQPPSPSLPFPTAWWGKILYGLFLTVIPTFSFWVVPALGPEWQDGKFTSYLILTLFPEASIFFILLLIYSIVSYLFLLARPIQYSQSIIIRVGIYTGVLLALQFSLTLLLYATDGLIFILLPVWILPIIISWVHRWGKHKWAVWKINIAIIAVLIGILIALGIYQGEMEILPIQVLAGLLIAAPFWSFLIALQAAIWLYKNHETKFTLVHGAGLTAWFITYAIGWRYDILKVLAIYSKLPTQPPNCYIATAAAQGHPRIVGSRLIYRGDGKSMRVNGQLQHLKCAELSLMAVSPRVHGVLRRIYDVVGRSLAQRMTNPFVADVAYLLLKPAEWFTVFILKKIVPETEFLSRRMYIDQ